VRRTAADLVLLTILVVAAAAAALIGAGTAARAPVARLSSAPDAAALRAVALRRTAPVRLRVPAIAVDSALQPLGLLGDGTLQAPTAWQTAGWYSGGAAPGEPGAAVIAGHFDSTTGPAVFYRLRQLRRGDLVVVRRRDGRALTFVVDGVASYRKSAFPTAAVYGPTPTPMLRLITCTGDFDPRAHSYLDNLVVSAHLRTT
jgi:hypothetical protein